MNASRNASHACDVGAAAAGGGGSGRPWQPMRSEARAAQAREQDFMRGLQSPARSADHSTRRRLRKLLTTMAASPPAVPTLSRTLRSRHVALISIGGIIGAGLFVGSSANIATVGPAVLVSYVVAGVLMFLVMRMLAEMAAADPEALSF